MRKHKWLAVVLAATMLLGMFPALAAADGHDGNDECVRYGQGYWKQWLAEQDDDWECSMGHTAEELLEMLNTPARGNPTQILLYQFIAAALNVSVGECKMPPIVAEAFQDALTHLGLGEGSDATRQDILGWKDILEFWNENKYAELLTVWYEGTGCTFGSHEDDTLTLTFSENIYKSGEVRMYFKDATPYLPEVAVVTWVASDNVLTLTANGTFITPRPHVGDYVVALQGIVDLIGMPVHVDEVPVEGDECVKAELLTAVYAGTGSTFGSHTGDTLTLAFTENIFKSGTVMMSFKDASDLPEVPVVTWTAVGNVLTLTANGEFITPRPEIGDYVMSLEGIVNACGCPVVVPDDGVEIVAMTYHYHWGPGFPYGATDDVFAVAIVDASGMEVWWYSDGTLISEGWYYDIYSIEAVSGYISGNVSTWNEPVRYLFEVHFPGVTMAWYLRTNIDVTAVPAPSGTSTLLP